jgi:dTDP-4-amino-4,6-dideoxygalactose transaminase
MAKRPLIFVSKPSLPPITDVTALLQEIWDSKLLSNNGPLLQRLEAALADHLGVGHISLVANAFLGLLMALRQAGVTDGEVVTTPFSFVATGHAISWAGATPVFADIDPQTLNLDPVQAERQITPQTRAIMPVHTFGTPCDVAAFEEISQRHGIPVIYDAAHAFAVSDKTGSVLKWGRMSVLSFHATKVFNTFEGGAVICQDRETKLALDQLCNFGITDEAHVNMIGLNAKMSEINAAIGLAQLPYSDNMIRRRGDVVRRYYDGLRDVKGVHRVCSPDGPGKNHYAFPILLTQDYPWDRDALLARLKAHDIFARRYFYPLISDLPMYRHLPSADPARLPISSEVASQILCLPLYPDLDPARQQEIIALVGRE